MKHTILLFFILIQPLFAAITEFKLDNGLKIIVKEDHRSPIFISQLWYKVGSADETKGITGISHMLEHMMFKGTKNYGVGEFSKIIAKNGGSENAFTSRDYTGYYQKMKKSKLNIAFKLEADRMQNLILNKAEFEKERKVVEEERRLRIEDNPNSKLYEKLLSNVYPKGHPYANPVIGWMDDIKNYKLIDLKNWYQKFYAPNNTTLVVVGDVEPEDIYKLANKYFGVIYKDPNIQKNNYIDNNKYKAQNIELKAYSKVPFYTMAYPVPSLKTAETIKEAYTLEMLAYLLDLRLTKKLQREKQIVASINTSYSLYSKYNSLFTFMLTPAEANTVEDIQSEVLNEITKLQSEDISIKELQRIKAQIEAQHVYEQDSISTQAYYLGVLETVGLGYLEIDKYAENMLAVDAAEIKKIAKKYLDNKKLSTAKLIPLKI